MRFFFEDNLHLPRVPTMRSRRAGSPEEVRDHYKRAVDALGAVTTVVADEEWRSRAADREVQAAATVFDYASVDAVADLITAEDTPIHSLRLALEIQDLVSRPLIALTMTTEPPEMRVMHVGTLPRNLFDEYPDLRVAIDAAMGTDIENICDKRGPQGASFGDT